ncbi:aryl hydrocarbon receptor nuclear translocator-like protein 1 isoform X2 [Apis laboriosa]|uniref:aryl hydrocarbon receptor nuclear translocator-like protein 1 isoform X2 n=1 Tax=Apis laboriosa TaxID=183418 RepID=UPI001CC732ED|nr:aryl hydrocarbon receptor nuclear translocator-like protein 1 isoform X2 [Apis laboriosa]XP_043784599.1 aryl hydrocarbon receptor nuclear translocator-like protein 1 isoform X2 [Apis laboriosa]
MYALLEGGLLADSGGVMGDDVAVVVGDGTRVNTTPPPLRQAQESQQDHRRRYPREQPEIERYREQREELEDLLCFQRGPEQEMVAQDMAQSYAHLLHQPPPGREHQQEEFISLDELQSRIHQDNRGGGQVPAILSAPDPYQQQQHQQGSYYSLSAVQESSCSTVYFGDIGTGSGVGEVTAASAGGGEGLSLTPTPATSNTDDTTTTTATPSTTTITIAATTTTAAAAAAATTTTTATANHTTPRIVTGAEPPQHMETPSTMVPDQAPASGHHYHRGHHHHHHHHHNHHHHHHHQRSASTTPTHGPPTTDTSDEFVAVSRKRKLSCHDGSDLLDDAGDDAKSVRTNDDSKKQNHSEIEKRRRDKMNTYITELSAMVPMCHAMSRKLDKLTVLRMAVQHLKTILGAVTSYTEGHYKPAFLSDQELKTLILQAAEGFVFVVGCDRGRILYVSESVLQTLNYSQGDLLGQSWFDILHPKDVAKVKEQLSSSDLSPRERLIDAKTMLPVKTDVPQGVSRLCPGARRSFFCRMKRKVEGIRCSELQVKEESESASGCHRRKKQQNVDWKYCVIQCTGYLKSWAPAKIDLEEHEGDGDGEACNLSCLVAVGRLQSTIPTSLPKKPRLRSIKFVSRHAMDGKFLFVDQRATLVLGFLPQELLGTSMYEYYHHDDIPHLAESHKAALQASESVTTQIYRFRTKGASFVKLQSEWKSFRNPWTKDIEYLIAKNSVTSNDSRSNTNSGNRSEDSSVQGNYDYFAQSNGGLERLISSHVEVSKIGRQIAEEVLDLQRRGEDSSSGSSPGPESALLNTESQITTTASPERVQDVAQSTRGSNNSSSNPTPTYNHIANNLQLNSIANDQGHSYYCL